MNCVDDCKYREMLDDANADLQELKAENDRLRELVYDMLVDEERGHNDDGTFYEHVRLAKEHGVEFRG